MNKPQQITIQTLEDNIESLRETLQDELFIHHKETETVYGFVSFYIIFKSEDYGDEEISELKGIFIEKTGMVIELDETSYDVWQDIYLGLPQLKEKSLENVPYLSRLNSDEKNFIRN